MNKDNTGLIKLPELPDEVSIAPDWYDERDRLISEMDALEVLSDADARTGQRLLSTATQALSELNKVRLSLSKPYRDAASTINAVAKEAASVLEDAKKQMGESLSAYARQKQIEAEQKRRELEEQQQAEIQRQIAEQQAMADLTGEDEAEIEIDEPAPVHVPEKVDGLKRRQDLRWYVENEDALPRHWLALDRQAVNEYKRENLEQLKERAGADGVVINGVRFFVETTVTG